MKGINLSSLQKRFSKLSFSIAAAVALSVTVSSAADVMVKAKRKPADAWKEYPTRTVEDLSAFKPKPIALDAYGGRLDQTSKATQFFRVEQKGGTWTLIDPLGHPFINMAVVDIAPSTSATGKYQSMFEEKFKNQAGWAQKTVDLLRELGFNSSGAWSKDADLRATKNPVASTTNLDLLNSFAKARGMTHVLPGHIGYPNDCMPVFHPAFAAWCAERTKALADKKDDPYILGYFSDNEMPYPSIDKYLALDVQADPEMTTSRDAARKWWTERKGANASADAKDQTNDDRAEWGTFVYEKYYSVVVPAIRKNDPNHLFLGSRLHFPDYEKGGGWRAAKKYVDVQAINYYGAWTPDVPHMEQWAKWSGRPFIVTEWYARGDDVGFANTSGAGWIVPTQADRGKFYQNFTLGLLGYKGCVGWHWFKYRDNDPEDRTVDPSNRDSNKGMVNLNLEPYTALTEQMKALNTQAYALRDFLLK